MRATIKLMQKRVDDQAHNSVTVDRSGVIRLEMRGKQTGETVLQVVRQIQRCMTDLRVKGKRTLVLTDLRGLKLTDMSTEARVQAKKVTDLHADAAAVLVNPVIKAVVS